MRLKFTTKSIILLVAISSLLSFTKFDHCFKTNWATPDVYVHACYSDLPALYGARDLIHKTWPYSSTLNAVEYPPLTGVVMWATSLVTPSGANAYRYYFLINALLIAFLCAGSAVILSRIKPEFWYLLPPGSPPAFWIARSGMILRKQCFRISATRWIPARKRPSCPEG